MNEQGRYMLVTVHKETGTHTLHNWPTLSYARCIQISQSNLPVSQNDHRLIMKSHNDSGEDVSGKSSQCGDCGGTRKVDGKPCGVCCPTDDGPEERKE